jgi:hypothetical protein
VVTSIGLISGLVFLLLNPAVAYAACIRASPGIYSAVIEIMVLLFFISAAGYAVYLWRKKIEGQYRFRRRARLAVISAVVGLVLFYAVYPNQTPLQHFLEPQPCCPLMDVENPSSMMTDNHCFCRVCRVIKP